MIRRSSSGFTLSEIAVVLLIISLTAGGIISFAQAKLEGDQYAATSDRLDAIDAAIRHYAQTNGYLPCPATTLSPVDPDSAASSAIAGRTGDCINNDSWITTKASYDVTGAGAVVRIGAVPTRALGLPDGYGADTWNHRFTYLMIRDLGVSSATGTSAPLYGNNFTTLNSLVIKDGSGNPSVTQTVANMPVYAIVSHGKSGMGGLPRNGGYFDATGNYSWNNLAIACAGTADAENCNRDTVIVDQRYNDARPGSASFYDDLVRWGTKNAVQPAQ